MKNRHNNTRNSSRKVNKTVHKPAKPTRGPSPIPNKAPGEFPMRINKYLAWKGYSTRRAADELIEKKQVTINGRFAVLGDKVNATDTVLVRNNKKTDDYLYYAYNKPRGITTEDDRKGSMSISKSTTLKGVFPVGGLDANAQGLIIMTNDRRIIDRLLNPAHAHNKEYLVHTVGNLRSNFKEKMENAPKIGKDSNPMKCIVKIIDERNFVLRISGADNHIRQLCSMFFAEIESLERVAILNVTLGRLMPNAHRKIEGEELKGFLGSLGL